MKFIRNLVHRFPKAIILIVSILTLFFGYHLKDITINTDLKSMFPADDPRVELFDRVSERYGGSEYVIFVLGDDQILDVQSLETIDLLTDTLGTIAGVTQVRSITNIEEIRGEGFTIEIGPLMRSLPASTDEAQEFREKVRVHDRYVGTLVSGDFRYASIIVQLSPAADQQAVVSAIQRIRNSGGFPEKTYLTGSPVLTEEIAMNMKTDILRLLPFVSLVVMLILFIGFRSRRGVALPLIIVFVSLICTMGFSAWIGKPLSIISTGLPVLLVSVGSAYAIHLLARYYEDQHNGLDRETAVSESIMKVGLAILMAGITTAIGFSSLGLSDLTIISDFGLLTAFGVGIALLISITFLPAVLLITPEPSHHKVAEQRYVLDVIFNGIARLVHTKYLWVIGTVLLMLILSLAAIPRIQPETNYIIFFSKDGDVREAHSLVHEKFGGSAAFEIMIDTGTPDGIADPEFLKTVRSFQDSLTQINMLANPMSIVDLLEEENKALHGGDKTYERIPDAGIAQYLLLLESDDDDVLSDFIDFDHQEARVRVMTSSTRSQETKGILQQIRNLSETIFGSQGYKVTITGIPVLGEQLMDMILSSQIRSLISAIFFAFIITSLMLRSAGKGLACSVPIAVTVLVNFGIMGWTAIQLDVATSMIASIAVGIGIDYSIHFYTRFQEERDQDRPVQASLEKAVHTVGRANYFNAVAVTAGFLVLLFSNFPPLRTFGLLSSLTMLFSFLGAMVLLPSLIMAKEVIAGQREKTRTK